MGWIRGLGWRFWWRRLGCAGSMSIEMALSGSLLVVCLAGAVDLGQAFFVKVELTHSVRAAEQYATLHPTNTAGIVSAAQNASSLTGITVATPTTSCECSDGTSVSCAGTCGTGLTQYTYLTISSSYVLTAQFTAIWTGTRTLSAQAKFRIS